MAAQLSSTTFTDIGGAVSDLFAAEGDKSKAAGDRIQGQDYDLAATLAGENEKYTETSTAIKEAAGDRALYRTMGDQSAQVAGGGFAASGSSLDIMRDTAAQGALTHAVTSQQGLITEAGYTEQQESFTNMGNAARMAADAEDNAATGSWITGAIKGVAAVASIFAAPATGGLSLTALGSLGSSFMGGGTPSGYGKG